MWLNSRSTFHKAGVGGMEGRAIQEGQTVPVGKGRAVSEGREVKEDCRPVFAADRRWEVEVVRGPNDDWVDDAGHQMFLSTDWKLSAKSDRTGFRLEGPQWTFTEKAHNKLPEHGTEPSNIIDQGYPCGAINLAGQNANYSGQRRPQHGRFHQSLHCAPVRVLETRTVQTGRYLQFQGNQCGNRTRHGAPNEPRL